MSIAAIPSRPRIALLPPPVAVAKLFSHASLEELAALGELRRNDSDAPLEGDAAIALLADCDIALGSWGTVNPATPGLLAACPQLRLWEHVAGTVKGMFGPHLEGRELVIASCAPAIADSVAEMTVGEIIIGLRRVWESAEGNRAGSRPAHPPRVCVFEATIGVLGASQVGRRVIRLLRALGVPRVLVYDPFLDPADAAAMGVERCDDLMELCRASLAVTLHVPALPATHRMLGAAHFAALRDGAVLVNTSRGAALDEAALIAELERGRITAFLDVSDPEPAAPDSPLRRLPNCHLTSHIAGGASHRLGQQAVSDVRAFLSGGSPEMVVTADMIHRLA